ncbi:MAG: hypothetical protein J07AB43_07720 [Candidatus Nanosalina sp. J07AB43]|nr:MAG: hypothetical protein J07AB43_07720 [Candidatus Nanosalina sp. J07AB43]
MLRQVKTKRGRIGFGEDNVVLTENYLDYFRNLYRDLWVEGKTHHKASLFALTFAISFGLTVSMLSLMMLSIDVLVVLLASLVSFYGFVWVVQRFRGFTTDRKISYDDIEDVRLVEGKSWLTCPRFIISYGQDKRRYVSMHSHLLPGVSSRIEEIEEGFEEKGF